MPSLNSHSGPSHGLLARTTKAVDGDARCSDWPSGREHCHTTDARPMIANAVAVTDDHIVYVSSIEANPLLKRIENLRQEFLGVNVM
jgi:hypothetical protein